MKEPRRHTQQETGTHQEKGGPAGSFYTWWRGDPLPRIAPLTGLTAERTDRYDLVARLAGLPLDEVLSRVRSENTPYLVLLDSRPAGYGWSARGEAEIGGLLQFQVREGERYLWDFATLPPYRGRGVYQRLLQAILVQESESAERFWIGHDAPNVVSGRGIRKAGFSRVGDVVSLPDGALSLTPAGSPERARLAADLLGIPLLPADEGGA